MAKKLGAKILNNGNSAKGWWASLHTTGLAAGPGRQRVRRTLRGRAGLGGRLSWANSSVVWVMTAGTFVSKTARC